MKNDVPTYEVPIDVLIATVQTLENFYNFKVKANKDREAFYKEIGLDEFIGKEDFDMINAEYLIERYKLIMKD